MFGDVEEKLCLEECCTLHARVGWQALKKDEHQESGDYMLITGTDFKDGKIDYSKCVYVSKERYDMDPYIQVLEGDILITKDGTIGKVAIVEGLPKPATLNAGVFVVRPDGRFNVGYFSYLFKGPIFADFVELSKTGSTIKHLNQAKLQKYEIPLAQPEKQEEFALVYAQSDKSKIQLEHALAELIITSKKLISESFD
jgi:type I restriction enzyme S subunit